MYVLGKVGIINPRDNAQKVAVIETACLEQVTILKNMATVPPTCDHIHDYL